MTSTKINHRKIIKIKSNKIIKAKIFKKNKSIQMNNIINNNNSQMLIKKIRKN